MVETNRTLTPSYQNILNLLKQGQALAIKFNELNGEHDVPNISFQSTIHGSLTFALSVSALFPVLALYSSSPFIFFVFL